MSEVELPTVVASSGFPVVAGAESVDDRAAQTHPAYVLPRQLLLAQDRAAWLGEKLRAQVERDGVGGIVGDTYAISLDGERVKVGEFARTLFEAERAERTHVSTLAERVARLGLDQRAVQLDAARWMASTITVLTTELGLSLDDESALRAARRAGLAGRRAMGLDDGDPDVHVGPRLTGQEKVMMLRAALAEAEEQAAGERAALAVERIVR